LLSLNGRDLRQLPLIERKEKLRAILDKSELPDVICGKYLEERGVDLFNEVCQRNLEGVVAKRKTGTYCTISGWLKIKNPNYTQSERRHELFEAFKTKSIEPQRNLPPIPNKPSQRAITGQRKFMVSCPPALVGPGYPNSHFPVTSWVMEGAAFSLESSPDALLRLHPKERPEPACSQVDCLVP
jgi:ATP dependent DNA ligase domain